MFRLKSLLVLIASIAVLLGISVASQAQTIEFYNTRGQRIESTNKFPLDRFSRGETIKVKVTSPDYPVYYDVVSDRGFERGGWNFWCAFSDTFVIPTSPRADNMYVRVYNYVTCHWVKKRIPIGTK